MRASQSEMLGRQINSKNGFITFKLVQQILIKRDFSSSIRCQSARILSANKCVAYDLLPLSPRCGHRFSTVATADTSLLRRESKYKEMEKDLKYREDPVIMTLDTPQFKSIFTENLIKLYDIFQKHNYEIRIAGGAVR